MPVLPFFYKETEGIRVTVRPVYLRDNSDPSRNHYVFAYFVRIENIRPQPVQLLSRRWLIHDSIGEDTEVIGEGVVGQQPLIPAGRVHEYHSFCVLKSPDGYMEGHYLFIGADGNEFTADIPRFTLSATASETLS